MMKITFCFLSILLTASFAKAEKETRFQGFVEISKSTSLYVDWIYSKPGKPTAVLLNGITYSIQQWNDFTKALSAKGIGVLRFDPRGMGETLLKYAPITEKIAIHQQAKDLHALLNVLKVSKPYNLVGLSYGGGLAFAFTGLYPTEVGKLIAMAPYTEPLREQDKWIESQVWITRQVQPWNPASDDELYDYFLRQLVYSTYPSVEPISMENPFKLEGIFRLAQGIRKFQAKKIVNQLPDSQFHLIIAGRDKSIAREVLTGFWDLVPQSKRGSMTVVKNVGHKVPEEAPRFSAGLVSEILLGSQFLRSGAELEGDSNTGDLRFEGDLLRLPRDND